MKKLVLFLLFVNEFTYAQEVEFKFTKNRLTDYVVRIVDGKSATELYKKTLDWVAVTYNNPKEVIKAQIKNDYIRIEGSKASLLCTKSLGMANCWNVRYQIEISFKDGKYKFDLIKFEVHTPPSEYSSGAWNEFDFNNTSLYYNSKGEIKSMYKLYPDAIETEFNTLNESLNDFLKSDTIPSKKSDW